MKLLLAALLCFTFLVIGFLSGESSARKQSAISEYKIHYSNLALMQDGSLKSDPRLREYFKARTYYFANQIPVSYVNAKWDFGPVDWQLLINVITAKGPGPDEYQLQLERHKSQPQTR